MKNEKYLGYENAEIEIIDFKISDVITTSNERGDDMDDDGWTTV